MRVVVCVDAGLGCLRLCLGRVDRALVVLASRNMCDVLGVRFCASLSSRLRRAGSLEAKGGRQLKYLAVVSCPEPNREKVMSMLVFGFSRCATRIEQHEGHLGLFEGEGGGVPVSLLERAGLISASSSFLLCASSLAAIDFEDKFKYDG